MWCTLCQCSAFWLERCHLGSASHKHAKPNAGKLNKQPGLSVPVEYPPQAQTSTRMGERMREARVTIFCNGDVEQPFTKE